MTFYCSLEEGSPPIDLTALMKPVVGDLFGDLTLLCPALTVLADVTGQTYRFQATVQDQPPWSFNAAGCNFALSSVGFDITYSTATNSADGQVVAQLIVAGVPVQLSADYVGGTGGWSFSGATMGPQNISLDDLVSDALLMFGLQGLPADIPKVVITELSMMLDTANYDVGFTCAGSLMMLGTEVAIEIDLGRTHDDPDKPTVATTVFQGYLTIGSSTFEVDFTQTPGTAGLAFTWSDPTDPLTFGDIAGSFGLSLPTGMDLELTSAGFSYDFDTHAFALHATSQHGDVELVSRPLPKPATTREELFSLDLALGEPATPSGVDDLLPRLADMLDVEASSLPASPSFLAGTALSDVTVDLSRTSTEKRLSAHCAGWLGFDVDDPSGTKPGGPEQRPALELDIVLSTSAQGTAVSIDGSVSLGTTDPVTLALQISTDDRDAAVIGTYRAGVARPLDLAAVAPAGLGLPRVAVNVEQVVLAWFKKGGPARCLLAVEISAADSLNPDLPIVGPLFPAPGLSIGCLVVAASGHFERADVGAINDALDRDLTALPDTGFTSGLNVTGRLDLGTLQYDLDAADPPATDSSTALATSGGTAPVPADSTRWVQVQRAFGPVHLARVGLAYDADAKAITVRLDAAVELAGLRLSMTGLGLSGSLADLAPALELDGIAASYTSADVGVEGLFLRREVTDPAPGAGPEEFLGSATIRTPSFTVSVAGGLSEVWGEVSLFVFAALNRDFGGPSAFYVKGLALGFGYNRDFLPPAIESVASHQFLLALEGPDRTPTPEASGAMLDRLSSSVPARLGSYWVAAGVKFESFGIIRSRAIALVRLGHDLEILLLGLSELTLPKQGPTYVRAELALKVSVKPVAGTALAEAMLTENSYVFEPDCHLTGRFAFALWFGDHPSNGDFVLSLGGYHPRFRRPAHYPEVPRLGIRWTKGALTIKGQAYFALTPSSVMAGGQLEAIYHDGDLSASFVLRAHFLIAWKPFFYDIEIGVTVRVSLVMQTFLGPVVLDPVLGADIRVWGPEFAGTARVQWGVLSFDVEFGAFTGAKPAPRELTWPEFRDDFLPDPASVCQVQITSGLIREQQEAGVGPSGWSMAMPCASRREARSRARSSA